MDRQDHGRAVMQTPLLVRAVLVDDRGRWVELAHPLDDLARSHRNGENHVDGTCEAGWQSSLNVETISAGYRASLFSSLSTDGSLDQKPGRLIGMAASAQKLIRLSAPYVDEAGIRFLLDSIAASTLRGVTIELFDPRAWEPARAAVEALERAVGLEGDLSRLRVVRATRDAPFAHLKVMVVDGATAYVGSANITAAGLAGRNLELGVMVQGVQVALIDHILDLYQLPY